MPFPVVPVIAAGASLLGQGINAFSQGSMNKKTRRWNEHMYDRQRADSLADWNMQNEYNSPASQMARYMAAGLNPNLIYGQSNEAATVRSSNVQGWRPEAPQVDLGGVANALMMYYDIKVKESAIATQEAQQKNIAADTGVKEAQRLSILASTDKTKIDTQRGQFELDVEKEIRDARIEFVTLGNKKLSADINYTLDNNERQALMNASSLREAVERILTMRLQRVKTEDERREIQSRIENLGVDSELKRADLILRSKGIYPGDPAWLRVGVNQINNLDEYMKAPFRNIPPIHGQDSTGFGERPNFRWGVPGFKN